MINAQALNGFITSVLLTYILILANRRSVLGNAANGPIFLAVDTLCVTVVGLLSAVVLVQTVAGWLCRSAADAEVRYRPFGAAVAVTVAVSSPFRAASA